MISHNLSILDQYCGAQGPVPGAQVGCQQRFFNLNSIQIIFKKKLLRKYFFKNTKKKMKFE